jgi:hypothetical protein
MWQAEVFYEIDNWEAIIVSSDIFPTKKQALAQLADEDVGRIAFLACSTRQDEGLSNPFVDESDVEGGAMMVACNKPNCIEDDRLAFDLVKVIGAWIKSQFEDDTKWPLVGSIFDGRVKEVTVHLN